MTKDRLTKLVERRNVLNARIQKMQARERTQQRKQDTRRKILVGSYFLKDFTQTGRYNALCALMQDFLTRDSDKSPV